MFSFNQFNVNVDNSNLEQFKELKICFHAFLGKHEEEEEEVWSLEEYCPMI